jgi:endonuclease/exonuclease/phosphatase family metal-dependent hydrolase
VSDRPDLTLRVATYNVLDPGFGTLAPWDQRRTNIATTITSSAATVIGLQEAGWTDVAAGVSVARDLATLTGLTLSDASFSGDAILYDPLVWSSGEGGHFLLPRGRGDRRRSAVWQQLRHRESDQLFLFVATHFSHGPERARARFRQARRIARRVRSLNRTDIPIIVLGDFNSWAGRSARTPLDAFAAAGYREAVPTEHAHRLDHIFVSPDLTVSAIVVADEPASGHASDHQLVWADLVR